MLLSLLLSSLSSSSYNDYHVELISDFLLNQSIINICWWIIVYFIFKRSAISVLGSGSVFVVPNWNWNGTNDGKNYFIPFINILKKHKKILCGTKSCIHAAPSSSSSFLLSESNIL